MITSAGIKVEGLHQVAARADDLDSSIDFYRNVVGCDFLGKFDPPGLAFFDLAGTRLLLEKGASPATLYLRVDDIGAAFETLRGRGVTFLDEPHLIHRDEEGIFGNPGSEEWMVFFRDPSANLLGLVSSRSI